MRAWNPAKLMLLLAAAAAVGGGAAIAVPSDDAPDAAASDDEALYNFDGEYGKNYLAFIRKMIPGYDHRLEMIGDIVAAQSAATILVIGPGHGEELVAMARALPDAQITAYEASDAMAKSSQRRMELEGLEHRVTILPEAFGSETTCPNGDETTSYDAVTLFNVLHLMPREEHLSLLRAAAQRVAPGGIILIAGMSVPDNYSIDHPIYHIADKRWERLGIDEAQRRRIHSSLGKTLFSISPEDLEEELGLPFATPQEVFRGIGNVMWYSQKRR